MTRIGLAVASVGLATALTACGGSDSSFTDQSAEDIANASKDAMADLKAVKVAGSVTTDGQQVDIDVQTNADGDCVGSIGIDGASAELIGVEGSTWFRPSQEFWEKSAGDAAEQIISVVGDKWVVVPEGEDGFGQFCDLDELLDQMLKDDDEDDEATFSKGDTEDIDGDEAIAIDQEDPEEGTSTGYVLVDEPHYLVKIEKTDGDDSGTVTFSEFDEEFDAEAPGEDETIDLDNMSS